MSSFIQNILFCDDIRTEQSGKDIAIGIYNGLFIVPQFPWLCPSFMIRLELSFRGQKVDHFQFSLRDPNDNALLEQAVPISFFDWNRPGNVALNLAGLIFPVPGEYKFYTRFDGEWELQRTLLVEKFNPAEAQARFDQFEKMMTDQRKVAEKASAA